MTMGDTSMLNGKQSATPLTYQRLNGKPIARKLWLNENAKPQENFINTTGKQETWDIIDSPQYVDFCNLIDQRDSFFDKLSIISTPLVNSGTKSSVEFENNLLSSFNNISISQTKQKETLDICNNYCNSDYKEDAEQYVVHNVNYQQKNQLNHEKCTNIERLRHDVIKPIRFNSPIKFKPEQKTENANKISVEEKKTFLFKANPVPKFSKAFTMSATNCTNHEKLQKANQSEKPVRKKVEIWKKKPFIPCPSKRTLIRPKTPPLSSLARAKERKRFDDAIKEKEKHKEEMKRMEELARKKEEEEEIARLRKQTVHKAQPVRKYKTELPKIPKRPLTEPISPKTLKRRRLNPLF